MKKYFTLLLMLAVHSVSHSQTWDPLANIPVGLAFPVVVALDGEIHVIGGGGPAGATDIHLRYKPSTDTWDTLAPVPYLAQQPAGAVVNGKIHYLGGGYPNTGTPLSSHYVYDPSSNTWAAAASLPIPRAIMEAASINGKLYAMSGQPDKTRVDEYDPAGNSWTLKNPLPDNNFWYSAMVVMNNEMYRFGGGGFATHVDNVHRYDSVSDAWVSIGTLPLGLHAPAGSVWNGLIYIAGGFNISCKDETNTFDPTGLSWNSTTSLPTARSYHELVTIDSCIYSVGGDNSQVSGLNVSLIRLCNPGNVSVNEMNAEKSLIIYPNPSTGIISFDLNHMSDLTIELFDLTGVRKMTMEVNDSKRTADISSLAPGIYFYHVINKKGEVVFTGKVTLLE